MDLKKLLQDLDQVKVLFPKLFYTTVEGKKWIKGDLDVCDSGGNYWDTFNIAILIPNNYPYGVPILVELSDKIPREEDRHISENGVCCVDIDHELLFWARKGISLFEFVRQKAYPFFANQLYFEEEDEYANGEYKHQFNGVKHFYHQKLRLHSPSTIVTILDSIIENKVPARNSKCLCGSGKKTKYCHEEEFKFLKLVGSERLKSDRSGFSDLIQNTRLV